MKSFPLVILGAWLLIAGCGGGGGTTVQDPAAAPSLPAPTIEFSATAFSGSESRFVSGDTVDVSARLTNGGALKFARPF